MVLPRTEKISFQELIYNNESAYTEWATLYDNLENKAERTTENGHDDVVSENLYWSVRDEEQSVEQVAAMNDCVAWRSVSGLKL